jgi:hypothetical protein
VEFWVFNLFQVVRAVTFHDLCAWDHAVYFGVDHHAVADGCVPQLEAIKKKVRRDGAR